MVITADLEALPVATRTSIVAAVCSPCRRRTSR